jgi:uncharacterized protein (TIGR02001 family)
VIAAPCPCSVNRRGERPKTVTQDGTTQPTQRGIYMRTSFGPLLGLAIAFMATPAFAEDTDPPKTFTVNGTATVVSDYRFRGISQTDKRFALQGSITVTHKSGLYASVWGSSIDDYITSPPGVPGSDQELDLIAGYKKTFGGTTIDGGVLYYYYPGTTGFPDTDFLEPYISVAHTFGPVTAKVSAAYAPKQKALAFANNKDDNLYGALDLSGSLGKSGIGVSGHLGHNFQRSFLSGGKKYTDWSVGLTYTTGPLTAGISYVDTSFDKNFLTSANGRDIAKAGVVGTIGVSF